jgi:plasmid stabilization system protein ParE
VGYEVTLTLRAKQDIASIWRYMRDHAPEEATPFCRKLMERALSLQTFPAGYPRLGFNRKMHQLTFGKYSIVFGVDERKREVKVYRFWHGAQNPRRFRTQETAPIYSAAPVTQPSP